MEMEPKPNSSAEFMINLSVQNFIPFLVLYPFLLKIEEYHNKKGGRGLKQRSRVLNCPGPSSPQAFWHQGQVS